MMNELKYIGAYGSLNLNDQQIKLLAGHDLFKYIYTVESTLKIGGIGERLDRVLLPSKTINFQLDVAKELIDKVRRLFNEDVIQKKPGKLWLNGSYVSCFVTESNAVKHRRYFDSEVLSFKAVALDPLWITEKRFDFSIYHKESAESGFKLPMGFPTFFRSRYIVPYIENPNSSNNLSLITLYGPCKDPMISINDHVYGVFGELVENERFEIDQRNKTVQKITAAGDVINVFSDRVKSPSVFEPFPRGKHIVSYDRTFSVSITIFEGSVDATWS